MSEHNSTESNLDYQQGRPAVREAHDSVGAHGKEFILGAVIAVIILVTAREYFNNNSNSLDSNDPFIYPGYVAEGRPTGDGGVEGAWIDTWMAKGKKVYNTNCILCHQAAGVGLPGGQVPPLKGSEWVDGGTERLAMIVLNGVSGPMNVAGVTYNQPSMIGWGGFSDEKLAQVLTYIRREFGQMPEGKSGVVTTEMMQAARGKYGERGTKQWEEADLLAVPADAELLGIEVDLNTGQPAGGNQ